MKLCVLTHVNSETLSYIIYDSKIYRTTQSLLPHNTSHFIYHIFTHVFNIIFDFIFHFITSTSYITFSSNYLLKEESNLFIHKSDKIIIVFFFPSNLQWLKMMCIYFQELRKEILLYLYCYGINFIYTNINLLKLFINMNKNTNFFHSFDMSRMLRTVIVRQQNIYYFYYPVVFGAIHLSHKLITFSKAITVVLPKE